MIVGEHLAENRVRRVDAAELFVNEVRQVRVGAHAPYDVVIGVHHQVHRRAVLLQQWRRRRRRRRVVVIDVDDVKRR